VKEQAARNYGFDIARALAILGMVIVNYKIAMNAEGNGPGWLIAFTGLFEGRAAALFVILAGIGISLMTKKSRLSMDANLVKAQRRTLWKRCVFLFAAGMGLYLLEWSADILHFYAFYIVISSFFIKASNKLLLASAAGILVFAQLFQLLFDYTRGWNESFSQYVTFWTWDGFLMNLLFNGYHPILPWLSFMLIGMWVGRFDFNSIHARKKMTILSLTAAVLLELLSYLLIKLSTPVTGLEIAQYLFSTKPMPPNMFYILSASSTALIFIVLCVHIAQYMRNQLVITTFANTGQLALSHYIGHFILLVIFSAFGLLDKASLFFTTACSFGFFALAMCFSFLWRKRYKRGPLELAMRKMTEFSK